jgi:hypothetical protein
MVVTLPALGHYGESGYSSSKVTTFPRLIGRKHVALLYGSGEVLVM